MFDIKQISENKFKVINTDLGVNVTYDNGKIKGTGARRYKDKIKETVEDFKNKKDRQIIEVFALADIIRRYSSNLENIDLDIDKFLTWLRNPYQYNREIRNVCKFYRRKNGIVSNTYQIAKTILPLIRKIKCYNPDSKDYSKKYMELIDLLDEIRDVELVRDCIFNVIDNGTLIVYIDGKNVQFLDLEIFKPAYMVNNDWQVVCDLSFFDRNPDLLETVPPEIQRAYARYKKSKDKTKNKEYSIPIKKTAVIKTLCDRNDPLGLPWATPALLNLKHKELLQEAEKAVIDKIVTMLLIFRAGEPGKDGFHPTKDQAKEVYNEIKRILHEDTKKGLRLIGLPYWGELDSLEIDLGIFDDKKYVQIDKDIFADLGISESLIRGTGGTYASSSLQEKAFISRVAELVEQIENKVINRIIDNVINTREIQFKVQYVKDVLLNTKEKIKVLQSLKDIGGSIKYLLEMIGIDFEEYIEQVRYEKEILKTHDLFEPYRTSYTRSKNEGGRPEVDAPENPGTEKDRNNKPS